MAQGKAIAAATIIFSGFLAHPVCAQTGACCVDGACTATVEASACCDILGCTWFEGATCPEFVCNPVSSGACCVDGLCNDTTPYDCIQTQGGLYYDEANCVPGFCDIGDTCANPIVVDLATDLPYMVSDTTSGRGDDYSSTCMGSYDGGEDIIYELTAAADVCLNISVEASDDDAGVALHDTCPLALGTCIAEATTSANPDEMLELELAAGTYYLMIDVWPLPENVDFDLTIDACIVTGACCYYEGVCVDDVAEADCSDIHYPDQACEDVVCEAQHNDECEVAHEMFIGSNVFDTTGASSTSRTMCDDNLDEEVWYDFTAPHDCTAVFHTCVDGLDTVMEVFEGDDCDSMVSVGCSDDGDCPAGGVSSLIEVEADTNDTFFVAISGYNGGAITGDLTIVCDPPPTGACCNTMDGSCIDDLFESWCAHTWIEGGVCAVDCGIDCDDHLDCVFADNSACAWDFCNLGTNRCGASIANMYADVCGADFALPPNGSVNLTDVLCVLNAFGLGNLGNCPNADMVVSQAVDCPAGNQVVNLSDILAVLNAFGAPSSPTAALLCDCPANP